MLIDDNPEQAKREIELSKSTAETLDKHYPGHAWAVQADLRGGVLNVFNFRLSGRWGFILKIAEVQENPKLIMLAGGELLERYRLKRGAFNEADHAALATDTIGNYVADKS